LYSVGKVITCDSCKKKFFMFVTNLE